MVINILKTFICYLVEQWKSYKHRKYLKRMKWTEQDYLLHTDPDVCRGSDDVKQFYYGYKFVHCFKDHRHYAYTLLYDYGPGGYRHGYKDITDWCRENCKQKYRMDIHRIWEYGNRFLINGLGNGDYVFYAFKDQKDYVNFILRWA